MLSTNGDLSKKGSRGRANVVTPYKKSIPGRRSAHVFSADGSTQYASIPPRSPKAKLKVHFFLNVGHQQGCNVVTSGTSVKTIVFSSDKFTIFIYRAVTKLTGIFPVIMYLKDCVWFSDSLVPSTIS